METAASGPDKSLKRSVLFAASFAAFIVPFLASALNIALPAIGKEFSGSAVTLGWVISGYILATAIFLLPFGRLSDIIGRKKIFSIGLILFTFSTFLVIFSWDITSLIVFRLLQGIAASMVYSTSMAIITAVFEPGERGKAIGINSTATYLGLSLGPILGGLFTQHFGWRSNFIVLLPFGIISIILVVKKIKTEWADAAGEKFDWKGSLINGFALLAFMYGLSVLPALAGWICLAAGTLFTACFIFIELNAAQPVFDFRFVLHNRVFTFSAIAALINYAATSAIGFFISLYLQYLKGLDARTAGFVMISQPILMMLLSPAAGRLSDKKNPGVIASFGMGITSVGLVFLCFINKDTHIAYLISALAILGAGFGLFTSPNSNAIMSSVEKKHLGVAAGTVGTVRMIGQMMSMGIAMMLLSLYIGKESISPSTYPGLVLAIRTSFLIFAILSIVGIFASLARNKG